MTNDNDDTTTDAQPKAEAPIKFSNVGLVRDSDGKLTVYVGTDKVLGALNPIITDDQFLLCRVPMSRVRLSENAPLPVTFEKREDNIIDFKNFRRAQKLPEPPNTAA